MPNVITHVIFAEEVLKRLPDSKYKTMIINHPEEYNIGTNGPDFLFFYGAVPMWRKPEKHVSRLGTRLHREKVNAQFQAMIDVYSQQEAGEVKDAMACYIAAHFLHWRLDSAMHPYVVYRTGFNSMQSSTHHHRLESMMDAINLRDYRGLTIKEYKTYECTKRSEYTKQVIPPIYNNLLKQVLDTRVKPAVIEKALKDWERAQRYMYDPNGSKTKFLKTYESLIKAPWLATSTIVPAQVDETYDIMNTQHREWKHPVNGKKSNASCDEIMQEAIESALNGLPLLFDALETGKSIKIMAFIGNRTYANGVAGDQMRRYHDDIYQ